MCAILGWAGKLPKGYISRMLLKMESRGRDGIGIAFRDKMKIRSFRQDISVKHFVTNPNNEHILSQARRSRRGFAHTRRASPGMSVDIASTHPFSFWKYMFAHNGKIRNWEYERDRLIGLYQQEVKSLNNDSDADYAHAVKYCLSYCQGITVDSMVIGPHLDTRDFSTLTGSISLVWSHGENLYVFRTAKEAVSATVTWRYLTSDKDDIVTIVASTPCIINAITRVPGIEFHVGKIKEYAEGHIYRVEPTRLVDEGVVPINQPEEDEWSSGEISEDQIDVSVNDALTTNLD